MAQFAIADDLAARLGITLTEAEETRAGTLLTLASGLIQTETKQTISEVENDTLTRPGSPSSRVRLPERPVTAVASVTLAGAAVNTDQWHLDGDELVRDRAIGQDEFLLPSARGWGQPDETLTIVYTHGYSTIPDAVRAVCLEAVVRVWVNPGSVMNEGYGSEQITYLQQGTPRGLLLTDAERRLLRESLRRQAGSVTLR